MVGPYGHGIFGDSFRRRRNVLVLTRVEKSKHSHISVSIREQISSHLDIVRVRHVIRELLQATALFLLVFIALHFSIQNFRIEGTSMSPTLANGQHILVSKMPYFIVNLGALTQRIPFWEGSDHDVAPFAPMAPSHGEVIAFNAPLDPSRQLMKRVIGVPGDTIEVDGGQVIRNGKPLNEPYVVNRDRRSIKPVKVPEGFYYVLGDNRPGSSDSRNWGFVPKEKIIGRAWFSYWPSNRFEFIHGLW